MQRLTKEAIKDLQTLIKIRESLLNDISILNDLRPGGNGPRFMAEPESSQFLTYGDENGKAVTIEVRSDVSRMIYPLITTLMLDRLELINSTLRTLNVALD